MQPQLPKTLQDKYMATFGHVTSAPTMTHLKCELMHAIWELLLDDEFMKAYEHRRVVKCADSVIQQIYPCFFTYPADYPEKYSSSKNCPNVGHFV